MNCLYITLFFNIVAGIVQIFIKSWNQILYARVIEVCRLPFEPRHDFFLHLTIVVELFSQRDVSLGEKTSGNRWAWGPDCTADGPIYPTWIFPEVQWWRVRNGAAPRIWRDFGSALPFKTRLTETKSVLPLSNEHGSQVKDQGRRHCCHNKHKTFSYRPTRDVSLLSGLAS